MYKNYIRTQTPLGTHASILSRPRSPTRSRSRTRSRTRSLFLPLELAHRVVDVYV